MAWAEGGALVREGRASASILLHWHRLSAYRTPGQGHMALFWVCAAQVVQLRSTATCAAGGSSSSLRWAQHSWGIDEEPVGAAPQGWAAGFLGVAGHRTSAYAVQGYEALQDAMGALWFLVGGSFVCVPAFLCGCGLGVVLDV
jgi:hypothetical protein